MALSTDYTWTWSVTSLKKRDQVNSEGATLEGAVVQTYWKVVGVDSDGNEGEFSGATPFTAVNVPAGSFAAFDDLTEATVLGWIQNVVNTDQGYADHISERVAAQIDEANIEDGVMPWAPAVEVVSPPEPGVDPAADPE
ncbi:MAG: hypothetical protein ISR34_11995 [Pirellulales bacterium]|nr:hypothetical protein [Pirellulales bacterium]